MTRISKACASFSQVSGASCYPPYFDYHIKPPLFTSAMQKPAWLRRHDAPALCQFCCTKFNGNKDSGASEKTVFSCIRRLRSNLPCQLCTMILERLGEPEDCSCSDATGSCVSFKKTISEHDMEWMIFYENGSKGSVIRNDKKKFKERHMEPVSNTLPGYLSCRLIEPTGAGF